eukprot:3316438-Rhodomonas_salina.1
MTEGRTAEQHAIKYKEPQSQQTALSRPGNVVPLCDVVQVCSYSVVPHRGTRRVPSCLARVAIDSDARRAPKLQAGLPARRASGSGRDRHCRCNLNVVGCGLGLSAASTLADLGSRLERRAIACHVTLGSLLIG